MDLPDQYKKVFEILKSQGATDEQIAQVVEGMVKAASDQFYADAITSLTEEDMKALDACQNQEEANKEIMQRYAQRTGRNPDELIHQFLVNFAEGFLAEYKKEHPDQS